MILNINLRTWKSCMVLHTNIYIWNHTIILRFSKWVMELQLYNKNYIFCNCSLYIFINTIISYIRSIFFFFCNIQTIVYMPFNIITISQSAVEQSLSTYVCYMSVTQKMLSFQLQHEISCYYFNTVDRIFKSHSSKYLSLIHI